VINVFFSIKLRLFHTGRSGSFISTPFATKLMSLLMSEIILVCEWKSQCSCIKIMSLSFKISLIELPQVLGGGYKWPTPTGMEESQFYGKKNIDHLVRTLPDGCEKIQWHCIELEGAKRSVIIICVYMPANGSKNHQVEY
jgi:hypothetical protein